MVVVPSKQKGGAAISPFEPIQQAFSKVVHAWNGVQRSFGLLFCEIAGLNGKMGLGIWYALKTNQAQHDLLEAAVAAASADGGFTNEFPKASEDIRWLLDRIKVTAEAENSIIRAEFFGLIRHNAEILPQTIYENLDVRDNLDERILSEFKTYEVYFNVAREFANTMSIALSCRHHSELGLHRPWPGRPILPTVNATNIEPTQES